MRPPGPPVDAVLNIRFFGHVYPVRISWRMDIHGAMAALKEVVPGEWEAATWAMFGLAAEEGSAAWAETQWDELKLKWMGVQGDAWVVMKM